MKEEYKSDFIFYVSRVGWCSGRIFSSKRSLHRARVYSTRSELKVEAADTVADLDGQTGTYKLVMGNTITTGTAGGWLECQINALLKKIWRYTVVNLVQGSTTVSINELELCNVNTASPQPVAVPTCSADDARTVTIAWPTPVPPG